MIGNMGALTNTILSGMSSVTSMKANLALMNKDLGSGVGTPSASSSSYANPLDPKSSEFLKEYKNDFEELKSAAKDVLSPKNGDKLEAGSDNSKVASVTGKVEKSNDSYKIEVTQLAEGQVNRSGAIDGKASMPSLGGQLDIRTEAGSFNVTLSASGYKTNTEMLKGYADKINSAKSGVSAKVVENKDGTAFLELSGEGNFKLSGSFAERTGLDKVASEGKEAVFTVTKNGKESQTLTSTTNTVEIDGITVGLKGVGNAVISAGKSKSEATADSLEKLVSSFNKTLGFLTKNDWSNGSLNQAKRLISQGVSDKSLEKMGITVAKDGSMSFDRNTFLASMEKDPTFTKGIVESFAKNIQSDATSALNQSSGSLVGGSVKPAGSSASFANASGYDMTSIDFISQYNRMGVYNASNMMVVGALMDLSV